MSYASTVRAMQSRVPVRNVLDREEGTTVIAKDGSILVAFTATKSRVAKALQANDGAYAVDAVRYANGFISHLG
jgi:uncharacterized protein YerC